MKSKEEGRLEREKVNGKEDQNMKVRKKTDWKGLEQKVNGKEDQNMKSIEEDRLERARK